jgi:hypothetical protein
LYYYYYYSAGSQKLASCLDIGWSNSEGHLVGDIAKHEKKNKCMHDSRSFFSSAPTTYNGGANGEISSKSDPFLSVN